MARILIQYAHPGHSRSQVNRAMADTARKIAERTNGIIFSDLYAAYPRHNIDVDREQRRLLGHEVILFQFPLFWYSTPSLIKEWLDLVLEHGFAYGAGGTHLEGKILMLAISAAGSEHAYSQEGYQHFPLRTFLTPLEQTARLCRMRFAAPYLLHNSLRAPEDHRLEAHLKGYRDLILALRDDLYDFDAADQMDVVTADTLPIRSRPRGAENG